MRYLAVLSLFGITIVSAAETPAPFSCPATLIPPGAGGAAREFERINIYNGKPGGEEYDLARDDQTESGRKITQSWFLKDYRSMSIFVRHRYLGTTAVKNIDIPAKYQKCTFIFELDKKNTIIGKPEFSCW